MTLTTRVRKVSDSFKARFQRNPTWIAVAPGRVNLIGEHTDYNDGFVLPMAIERYNVVAAAPAEDPKTITWMASELQEDFQIDLTNRAARGVPKWSNYIRGVVAGFQEKEIPFEGFDAVSGSNVPVGGGLSSSAALEVSAATLLEAVAGTQLDPIEKALLCQKAENEFAGVPCGIMDQIISVKGQEGHLLLIDCRSVETTPVPMNDPSLAVLIFNTNVKHDHSEGEYAEHKANCDEAARVLGVTSLRDATPAILEAARPTMDPLVFRRARHVINENQRTLDAAAAIQARDWNKVGQLMYASHDSLRDDYEVSCAELDVVVDLARQIGIGGGVYGCRLTGGGFGGCTVALVKSSAVNSISKKLTTAFKREVGIDPAVFVSLPAAGAAIIKS